MRLLVPLLLCCLLLQACGGGGGGSNVSGNQWTVLVYLDADNELDISSPYDIKEMQAVGSTANVTFILQYDTRASTTRRYRVDKGKLTPLADLGELDMSAPATLRDFVTFGVTTYPAEHYALIISDHGNGWKSPPAKQLYSILQDWTNNGRTAPPTANNLIARALLDAQAASGVHLDILGIDACIMATLEAAYEFKDAASIMVSSQELLQGLGWDYTDLFNRLTANPRMDSEQFAAAMVTSYRTFVESASYGYSDQTISALRMGEWIAAVAQAADSLASSLAAGMGSAATMQATLDAITSARKDVQVFASALIPATYVDLFHFDRLQNGDTTMLQKALTAATIAEYHGQQRPNAHGLSIVFVDLPLALSFGSAFYDPNYRNYDPSAKTGDMGAFINLFRWDEMMNGYLYLQYPELIPTKQ